MVEEGDHLPPGALNRFAAVFYVTLAGAGLAWTHFRTGRPVPETLAGGESAWSLVLGIALAVGVVILSRVLLDRISWMSWLAREIRRLLGPVGTADAAALALLSGIGEEIFFRGAMQPALGYVATSLIFGLLHTGPERRYLAWTAFAVAMGFALGAVLQATGSLVGPIAAHVLVNFVNLRRIGRLPPSSIREG